MKGNVFFGLVHLTWEDNPFGREEKFTSKYIIVGGEGGIRDLQNFISLGQPLLGEM